MRERSYVCAAPSGADAGKFDFGLTPMEMEADLFGVLRSGTITSTADGTGVSGVTVNLTLNSTGTVIASTTTGSSGDYLMTDQAPGEYTLTASKIRFWSESISVTVNVGEFVTANCALWLKGDLNNNGISADAGDLAMMKDASVGKITADWKCDLNTNGMFADAGDQAMMKDASVGKIELL